MAHAAKRRAAVILDDFSTSSNMCWESLRTSGGGALTPARVDAALVLLVTRENPSYTQLWNSLTQTQKFVLKAVINAGGLAGSARPVKPSKAID